MKVCGVLSLHVSSEKRARELNPNSVGRTVAVAVCRAEANLLRTALINLCGRCDGRSENSTSYKLQNEYFMNDFAGVITLLLYHIRRETPRWRAEKVELAINAISGDLQGEGLPTHHDLTAHGLKRSHDRRYSM